MLGVKCLFFSQIHFCELLQFYSSFGGRKQHQIAAGGFCSCTNTHNSSGAGTSWSSPSSQRRWRSIRFMGCKVMLLLWRRPKTNRPRKTVWSNKRRERCQVSRKQLLRQTLTLAGHVSWADVHLRAFSQSFFFYFKSVNKPERRVNIRIQGVRGRRRKHQSHFHGNNLSFLIPFLRFLLSSFGALMFKDTLFSRLWSSRRLD